MIVIIGISLKKMTLSTQTLISSQKFIDFNLNEKRDNFL